MNDMNSFLEEMSAAVTEYSEALTRRLIEKITIFDEKIVVELKSSLQVEVEKKTWTQNETRSRLFRPVPGDFYYADIT